MRNLLLTISFCLITSQAIAQWVLQNIGVNGYLHDIYFVNTLKGWICGPNEILLMTDDGGLNWKQIDLGFNNDFYAIFFVNENIGWIVGSEGLILKTINGGEDWYQQNSNTSNGLSDVFFVDENNGWITTGQINDTEVLKTTNGGESWTAYKTGIITNTAVHFTNVSNGWVIGWGENLSRTTDSGINWSLQASGTSISKSDIFFINEKIGWLFGGTIAKTTNGGNSWFIVSSFDDPFWVNSGFFINENVGWVCGTESTTYGSYGKIFKTTDGGTSWVEEFSKYETPLYSIFFEDEANGWVSGMNGFVVGYDTTKYLQVISPNGGEQWLTTSIQIIRWQKNNVESVQLLYSTNSGQDWLIIADNVDADNLSYYWNTPPTTLENCIIKIMDMNDPGIYDLSDNTFSIIYDPQITITLPNGGESISRGSMFGIRWTNQQVEAINILYSLNSGLDWRTIISDYPTSYPTDDLGYITWDVPDTISELCLIKIESSEDNSVFDVSNNHFKIINTPPFSYFPLTIGNKWFFSYLHIQEIFYKLEVEKDSILDDGHSYAKLNYYRKNNDGIFELLTEGYAYIREDSGKIIKYPNSILLNYKMNIGDTASHFYYSFYSVLDTFLLENVFDRYLSTFYFFNHPYMYYTYTDSIGFNTLSADTWYNRTPQYLFGCVIDGVTYGVITKVEDEIKLPSLYYLSQNFPNPFNPTTKIKYQIPHTGFVSLKVYDLLGREVATLVNEEKLVGEYEVEFNGSYLSSGVYFYRLQSGSFLETKKLILMK